MTMNTAIHQATADPDTSIGPELAIIPLEKLHIHPDNVRKTPLNDEQQDELSASIEHQGLIEPLACIPHADDSYLVIAGGRRLLSLVTLTRTQRLPLSLQSGIPCHVFPADIDVTLISLTENKVRFEMNPADQIVAWRDLFKAGHTVDAIASRFGSHAKLVQQRLKLSNLIPEILELLRDGKITLRVASTFSLLGDEATQRAALAHFDSPEHITDSAIKHLINSNRTTMKDNIPRIIGMQAYTAAGGTYIEDLFTDRDDGSHIMITDPDLMRTLFVEKCNEIETGLLNDGWKWVEITEMWEENSLYKTTEISGADLQITKEETARINEIEAALSDDASDKLPIDEFCALEQEKRDINAVAQARRFTPENRAKSGVVVRLANGYIDYHFGRTTRKSPTGAPTLKPSPDIAKPDTLYSGALCEDIGRIRTYITRAALLHQPRLCLDMLAFKMATNLLIGYSSICDINLRNHMDASFDDHPMADHLGGFWESLDESWSEGSNDLERFEAFLALPEQEKDRWLTWAVISSYNTEIAADDPRNARGAIPSMLNIDWHLQWRPDEAFWKRLSKPAMIEMLSPVLGDDWFNNRAGLTKRELARLLGEICTGESNQVTATQADAVRNWQIPGLAPLVVDSLNRDTAAGEAPDDTDSKQEDGAAPHQDQNTLPDKPRFTMTKARLTPVQAENGGIRIDTEEIPLEDDNPTVDPTSSSASDYAEASQSAAITHAAEITAERAEEIKAKLGAKPGTVNAALVDGMADRIMVIDMTGNAPTGEPSVTQPDTMPDLPAFLRRD